MTVWGTCQSLLCFWGCAKGVHCWGFSQPQGHDTCGGFTLFSLGQEGPSPGGLLARTRVATRRPGASSHPPPLVCRPAHLPTFVGMCAGFNHPYRGARVGGKVAQPRRPPADPSGTDVTVPGWRPLTATFRRPPFFGSMSAFGRRWVFLPGTCVTRSNFLTPKEGDMLPIFFGRLLPSNAKSPPSTPANT